MPETLLGILGAGFALWWVFAVLIALTFGCAVPLMVWSATRSLKGIRRELERLNDGNDRRPSQFAPSRDARADDASAALPNVPLFTRTGPLNIR